MYGMTMKQCTERIPTIFGITGHRDIFPQHESVIQEMIQKILIFQALETGFIFGRQAKIIRYQVGEEL